MQIPQKLKRLHKSINESGKLMTTLRKTLENCAKYYTVIAPPLPFLSPCPLPKLSIPRTQKNCICNYNN